jgi:serine/threonine protein kinase
VSDARLPERFANPVRLGEGGQGITWRARDTELDRDVAVKVLDLSRVRDWKAFELFERECNVLASIDHRGVPDYLAHVRDDDAGQYYLVMELIEGHTLAQDLAQGRRRTVAQLTDLLRGLLEILAYLHGLRPPVIHRDIKPGNVVCGDDGRVVLVDFGAVARPFHQKGGSTMIGSFGYMAPEQLHAKAGPRTDLYALGATIAAIAAGTDAEDLPRRGLTIDLDGIFDPGPLRTTVEAMLAADPDDRPPSAPAALASLDGAPALPPATETRAVARRTTSAIDRPTPKMVALGAGAGLLASLAVMTRSPLLIVVGGLIGVLAAVIIATRARRES